VGFQPGWGRGRGAADETGPGGAGDRLRCGEQRVHARVRPVPLFGQAQAARGKLGKELPKCAETTPENALEIENVFRDTDASGVAVQCSDSFRESPGFANVRTHRYFLYKDNSFPLYSLPHFMRQQHAL
jgi:hypothetical protein